MNEANLSKFSGATMNGIQQWGGYSGQQLAPQGLLGGLLGASLGGRGFGGGLNNAGWTNQSGQNAGGFGGANLQFQQDPLAQAYAQQQLQQQLQQLNQQHQQSPQGFWGNNIGQSNQQSGSGLGGLFGQSGMGSNLSSGANQQGYGQNQQLQQLMPNVTAPVQGANIASGNFGSLRGQTAYNKAIGDATAQMNAQQRDKNQKGAEKKGD
jgi:hypothetical protein